MKPNSARIGWCYNCNVPILNRGICGLCHSRSKPISVSRGELKPIFQFERDFYNEIIDKSIKRSDDIIPQGSFVSNNSIVVDGVKTFRIYLDKQKLIFKASPYKDIRFDDLKGSNLKKAIKANEHILRKKEREAISFLKRSFKKLGKPAVVSFSGGKDSACAFYLARKVKRNIPVIYMNTTLDFPETVSYIHNLKRKLKLNLVEIFPEHGFLELCRELGPPSSFMPWCCQTQKFAPFNKFLNKHFPKGLMSVEGLRRLESTKRMSYKRISSNRAIPRKKTLCPILDWSTIDVWLYILWRKIPFNPIYEYGYQRIGCWACPHRSMFLFKLAETTHPKLIEKWYGFLMDYAKNNGKDRKWVIEGNWRKRCEAYVRVSLLRRRLCAADNTMVYDFGSDRVRLERIKEYMKIFGDVRKFAFGEIIRGEDIEISIIGTTIRMSSKTPDMMRKFEKQLSRAINCIGCGACVGACEALIVNNNIVSVDENKCKHCLSCISSKYLRMSCIALNYRKKRYVWQSAA